MDWGKEAFNQLIILNKNINNRFDEQNNKFIEINIEPCLYLASLSSNILLTILSESS